jgi:hypothetical protein
MEVMREGIYPPDPHASTATEITGISTRAKAPFETACQIIAEVDYRLTQTGVEGKLLVLQVLAGNSYWELYPEARNALNYVVGNKRKMTPYNQWKAIRKHRNMIEKHHH